MLCGIYKPANWYAIVYLWAVYQFFSALFQCSISVFVLSIWKFFANPKLYTPNYHSIVWCVTKRIWREIKLHIWMRKHIIEMPLHTHYSPSAAHNNRHFLRTASLSLSLRPFFCLAIVSTLYAVLKYQMVSNNYILYFYCTPNGNIFYFILHASCNPNTIQVWQYGTRIWYRKTLSANDYT